jgi:hypothetical protein
LYDRFRGVDIPQQMMGAGLPGLLTDCCDAAAGPARNEDQHNFF